MKGEHIFGGADFMAPWETVDPALLHGYRLSELDRDSGPLWADFHTLDDEGPLGALAAAFERQGHVTVLDAGCGTGNQLRSLVDQARLRHGVDPMHVWGDGVSDHDFSQLSREVATRQAYETGALTYTVADLETDALPANAYDLVYSYEVLVHNQNTSALVRNMWQALRPGGVLYFNTEASQFFQFHRTANDIATQGGITHRVVCEPPEFTRWKAERDNTAVPTRFAFRFAKPLLAESAHDSQQDD